MNVSWCVTEQHNALMPPAYLTNVSAWHGHIPFAFWLAQVLEPECFVELGVHAGDSYMAWCQGIQEMGEPCRAYGIDNFEGDEHSGDYGEGMYNKVLAVHDPPYGKFSTIVESKFEAQVARFEDHEIDLLHIDGCHTYEACDRDFRMWLPKMSARGVMVLHDTQVTNVMGFGVFQKWDELNLLYPSFDFFHSSGLGMLLVGPDYNDLLSDMCAVNAKSEGQWIREYFEVLASRVHAQRNARQGNGLPN